MSSLPVTPPAWFLLRALRRARRRRALVLSLVALGLGLGGAGLWRWTGKPEVTPTPVVQAQGPAPRMPEPPPPPVVRAPEPAGAIVPNLTNEKEARPVRDRRPHKTRPPKAEEVHENEERPSVPALH